MARRGQERRGAVWHGEAGVVGRVWVRHGMARQARHGKVWMGRARQAFLTGE